MSDGGPIPTVEIAAPPPWRTTEDAPRDGRWFLVLRAVTLVGGGGPARAVPELQTIRRERVSSESAGVWMSNWGHSVADHIIAGGMWAELDALPLTKLYAASQSRSLRPLGLPYPLGSGRPL